MGVVVDRSFDHLGVETGDPAVEEDKEWFGADS